MAPLLVGAMCWWSLGSMAAQDGAASAARVRGVVVDATGRPVAGATIRMEQIGEPGMEMSSEADGSFAFAPAGSGHVVLSARKGALRSKDVDVDELRDSARGQVVLMIKAADAGSALGAQAMEFSDSPSFAIAGVTDWTAAGGHGSDAILRTSESLTRDAVQLKQAGGAKVVADPALKQALALQDAGEYAKARRLVGNLLLKGKTADLLRLEGELDEKLGDAVAAVNELEQAVHEDGSEENYFAWGSELLVHRAIWQAKDVFTTGVERYPKSARMLTALGAALFACSLYEEAAQKLCEATELSPESDQAYIFLGKAEMASPKPLRCPAEKLEEFVKRRPENPLANYYDAMAIWKGSGRSNDPQVLGRVEALLKQAVALDAKCSDAYLQLGNLNVSRHENAGAIADYRNAIEANPQLAEAHYRLGLAYDRAGDHEKAKREFAVHEELNKQQAAEVERERREVKQFLVKGSGATHP